ncbi:MAG: MBOAT family protein [Clostridiaceae bacterium]|nr:MBOAT family protein [Clostridiaceae bacterium]
MSMTDISFIFVFLPISLLIILLKPNWQKYFLLALSLVFYSCGSPKYLFLFVGLTIINTFLAHLIQILKSVNVFKKVVSLIILIMGILINIVVLFYYKYYDFSVSTINSIFNITITTKNLLLPMGISFFSFKAISLLIDVYKNTIILNNNPAYSMLYLSFYSQVISGPIARYGEFYANYTPVNLGKGIFERFSQGSHLFLRGFCKKVLFANILSPLVVEVFSSNIEKTPTATLWIGSIAYSLQLYYDFSGYSDMAIGIGQMHGINCKENFNYPYSTSSISEFWRRWHISLGSWFRDYIYFPMGGSRVNSKFRLYFNLLIVWLLTGIWHGANWTFIFWGFVYFFLISFEKTVKLPERIKNKPLKLIYRILCLLLINFQWIIFNSPNISYGLRYIKYMIIGNASDTFTDIRTIVLLQQYGLIMIVALILVMPVIPKLKEVLRKRNQILFSFMNLVFTVALIILFIFGISFVMAGQNNPFLYGNF